MDVIKLNLVDKEKQQRVLEVLEGLTISGEKMTRLRQAFEQEIENGLCHGLKGSSLQMENTYVPELINGKEQGSYLALDLGGTNFRVMLLDIESGKIVKEMVSYYTLDEDTRLGPGMDLFDFLANCIMDFIKHHKLHLPHGILPLGFTFSFPMTQQGLGNFDFKTNVKWGKNGAYLN